MKEIKATAPTREELYQEYKRLSEENERLKLWRDMALSWHRDFKQLENKTND